MIMIQTTRNNAKRKRLLLNNWFVLPSLLIIYGHYPHVVFAVVLIQSYSTTTTKTTPTGFLRPLGQKRQRPPRMPRTLKQSSSFGTKEHAMGEKSCRTFNNIQKAIDTGSLLYLPYHGRPCCHCRHHQSSSVLLSQQDPETVTTSTSSSITSETTTRKRRRPICVYRNKATNNQWDQRIELEELSMGQELRGVVVHQLANATTGPKLFLDVGVGRYHVTAKNPKWKIQNAMLRLGSIKESVLRKKVQRMMKKDYITVYVNRIDPSSDRLEVVLSRDDITPRKTFIPMKDLYVGQELNGTVCSICPYGIFLDVGANRIGLLHITKIAHVYQKYIHPDGITQDTDITIGLRMKVQLISKEKRRLFFDFTNDVKEKILFATPEIEQQSQRSNTYIQQQQPQRIIKNKENNDRTVTTSGTNNSERHEQSFPDASNEEDEEDYDDDEEEDEEGYDSYDEERDIEDQLGLGFY